MNRSTTKLMFQTIGARVGGDRITLPKSDCLFNIRAIGNDNTTGASFWKTMTGCVNKRPTIGRPVIVGGVTEERTDVPNAPRRSIHDTLPWNVAAELDGDVLQVMASGEPGASVDWGVYVEIVTESAEPVN